MILSCKLVPFIKGEERIKGQHELLKRKRKKVIMLEPDMITTSYKFRLLSSEEYSDVNIELNGLEIFMMHLKDSYQENSSTHYVYETSKIPSKNFLALNLGFYHLAVSHNDLTNRPVKQSISPLHNTQRLLTDDHLNFMHNTIVTSSFFQLFTSDISRSNINADFTPEEIDKNDYWFRIYLARMLLSQVNQILNKSQRMLSKINDKKIMVNYSSNLDLMPQDLEWLSQNPQQVHLCKAGDFEIRGRRYNVEKTQKSTTFFTHDIYENRLIIFSLLSMMNYFESQVRFNKENTNLPIIVLNRILDSIRKNIKMLKDTFGLYGNPVEAPKLSPIFVDDPFYSQVYYSIALWFSLNNNSLGDRFFTPVPVITKIFEYYSIAQIIESLKSIGFEEETTKMKSEAEIEFVTLRRKNHETISIYYEPIISQSKNIEGFPIKISERNYKEPDIVISYKKGSIKRLGVIDPKFTSKTNIEKLSKDVFYKYGLFFHREDGSSIDYVATIFPNIADNEYIRNFRAGSYANRVNPFLGILSIPMDSKDMEYFQSDLLDLILGSSKEA